ncbi:hypothetical protein BH11PSE8_BH11PSE8_47980 [soil metagenome]
MLTHERRGTTVRGRPGAWWALVTAVVLGVGQVTAAGLAQADPLQLSVTASEPRAYGYLLGDVVTRTIEVHVPQGLVLDESSVPLPGARGKAIELRTVARRSSAESGGRRHDLTLQYQVFLSPTQTRTLETPTFTLRFTGQPRPQELRIEGWPITVSPIMPLEASPRRGLGDLQPDAPPPSIATSAPRHRLIAYAAMALLLSAYLAHVYIGLPFWARTRRPFTMAWRSLRGSSVSRSPDRSGEAYRQLHEALNRTAGEVVFEGGVERFVATQPRFAPLREDIATFFAKSRQHFFAEVPQSPDATDDAAWLLHFARRCRNAERGSA